ncbi:MAG: hypothetical protein GXO00_02370 [Candidatus Diapherotrites archaeon]|nr:hypothetical protein [Candidatus Diapherotrites archaeon]
MRSQQGIGTILILIAIVLASVIAAYLLIQTADQLKTKAMNLQREHEQMIVDRVLIKEVKGVVGDCGGEQCVTYLLIKLMLAPGANPLDLRKLLMSFTTNDMALQGITYVPPEDLYQYSDKNSLVIVHNLVLDDNVSPYPACRATLINVMNELATFGYDYAYDIAFLAEALDPFSDSGDVRSGTFYTALWTDCYDKGDTQMLLPNQEIIVFYKPKRPLNPSEPFTIEFGTAQGYSTAMELLVPRGFEGRVVTIYP